MRELIKKKSILLITTFFLIRATAYSQIDCNSATGVAVLMVAPVILSPTDVDEIGGSNLIVKGQTKIFLNPPTTIPSACAGAITMYVFYSPSQTELSGYPNLASRDLSNLFAKPNLRATISAATEPNLKNCIVTIPRSNLVAGQIIYYRWAKLVNHPTSMDPVVWSSIMSFTVTNSNVSSLRFDVDLELDNMSVNNVRDLDGTEDLIGAISFISVKALAKKNETHSFLWRSQSATSLRQGTYQVDKRISLLSNITIDELKNIELRVGGGLMDDERPLMTLRAFNCAECTGDTIQRILKFASFPSTQSSIADLQNNGNFQPLKFGSDNYFELNYYERSIKEDGWVRFRFRVLVKPLQ